MRSAARSVLMLLGVFVFGSSAAFAQEQPPVSRDSMRVFVPGCTRGLVLTAGRRTQDDPGSLDIPEGMHLRMTGPKALMAAIKAHEGAMIEITGLVKKGQRRPDGIGIGGGVRITPGPAPQGGSPTGSTSFNQIVIDVEGWRPIVGECPSR